MYRVDLSNVSAGSLANYCQEQAKGLRNKQFDILNINGALAFDALQYFTDVTGYKTLRIFREQLSAYDTDLNDAATRHALSYLQQYTGITSIEFYGAINTGELPVLPQVTSVTMLLSNQIILSQWPSLDRISIAFPNLDTLTFSDGAATISGASAYPPERTAENDFFAPITELPKLREIDFEASFDTWIWRDMGSAAIEAAVQVPSFAQIDGKPYQQSAMYSVYSDYVAVNKILNSPLPTADGGPPNKPGASVLVALSSYDSSGAHNQAPTLLRAIDSNDTTAPRPAMLPDNLKVATSMTGCDIVAWVHFESGSIGTYGGSGEAVKVDTLVDVFDQNLNTFYKTAVVSQSDPPEWATKGASTSGDPDYAAAVDYIAGLYGN